MTRRQGAIKRGGNGHVSRSLPSVFCRVYLPRFAEYLDFAEYFFTNTRHMTMFAEYFFANTRQTPKMPR